ncbi:hypothetical protein ACL02S_06655 [Nocardia sp. 004]|uniref:hypothetical protein n=1 Tax=Nocardia sp. 004 TaxID=3385978 RepID=UPI0039A24E73
MLDGIGYALVKGAMIMGPDRPPVREQLEIELVRAVVLARRRLDSLVRSALALGAELMEYTSEHAVVRAATRVLQQYSVDEDELVADPRGALCADLVCDRRGGDGADSPASEEERRRQRRTDLLCEVRTDLLEVLSRCQQLQFDRSAFVSEIARGLCAATDKLVIDADMDTYNAWRRGMLLGLSEVPIPNGPPRVMATVDAGPGRDPVTVEWDSCERRLALVARMTRAGVSPVVICDRLLADLSVSSPLRYSER